MARVKFHEGKIIRIGFEALDEVIESITQQGKETREQVDQSREAIVLAVDKSRQEAKIAIDALKSAVNANGQEIVFLNNRTRDIAIDTKELLNRSDEIKTSITQQGEETRGQVNQAQQVIVTAIDGSQQRTDAAIASSKEAILDAVGRSATHSSNSLKIQITLCILTEVDNLCRDEKIDYKDKNARLDELRKTAAFNRIKGWLADTPLSQAMDACCAPFKKADPPEVQDRCKVIQLTRVECIGLFAPQI
jgi:seryl-tRNA synthetase